jgi:hypothetical protein
MVSRPGTDPGLLVPYVPLTCTTKLSSPDFHLDTQCRSVGYGEVLPPQMTFSPHKGSLELLEGRVPVAIKTCQAEQRSVEKLRSAVPAGGSSDVPTITV